MLHEHAKYGTASCSSIQALQAGFAAEALLVKHKISGQRMHICACSDERDARRGDIEHLAGSLVGKVNECVSAIDEGELSNPVLLSCLVTQQAVTHDEKRQPARAVATATLCSSMPCTYVLHS